MRQLDLILALALLMPAAAASQRVRTTAGVTVPFEYEDARVYVPVRVGDGSVHWFILDTGAQPTLLEADLATSRGLRVAPLGEATGAGRGSTRTGVARDVSLMVGTVALGPLDVTVAPIDSVIGPSSGRAIPGIIGSRFFREHVVELDFVAHVMHLHDPASYRYHGTGTTIPLDFTSDVPMAHASLTTPGGARLPMHLLVDLGAKSTLLVAERFVDTHRLHDVFPEMSVSLLGAGMGGATRYGFVRAPRLELEGTPPVAAPRMLVGLSVNGTLRSTWYDGLLGAAFLSRYRVIFDYAHRQLILEAREAAEAPMEWDMSGMFVLAPDAAHRRFVVAEVAAGTPAASAGIRAGDVIVMADGRPASSLTLGALRETLRAGPGHTVRLSIVRDGTTLQISLVLRRLVA